MRSLRKLKQGVWYEIRTRINNREPLFRRYKALALFARVFGETKSRFDFAIQGLRLEDDWLWFYIKPADGLELPAIMQWLKQTFAQRYNRLAGRIGHIWGDRYWSRILDGEPELAEEVPVRDRGAAWEQRAAGNLGVWNYGVRPQCGKPVVKAAFSPNFPRLLAPAPG
ncbi:MAG: transposase [Spirochaetaceae bacterium]|jgi:REP element-mobilizing transposase RayT|nr:transposase [Spirochaetaceae bacterium]